MHIARISLSKEALGCYSVKQMFKDGSSVVMVMQMSWQRSMLLDRPQKRHSNCNSASGTVLPADNWQQHKDDTLKQSQRLEWNTDVIMQKNCLEIQRKS